MAIDKELSINDLALLAGVPRRTLAVQIRRDIKVRPVRQGLDDHGRTINFYAPEMKDLVDSYLADKAKKKAARAQAAAAKRRGSREA